MTPTVPTTEPSEVYAGTTVTWTKEFSDFPADTYTLKYEFHNTTNTNNFTVTTTASGLDFLVYCEPDETEEWTAGDYEWFALASLGNDTYIAGKGTITVLGDPTSGSTVRVLSHARTVLAKIRAVIEGTADSSVMMYTINGRSLQRRTLKELREMESDYAGRVAEEEKSEAIDRGETSSGLITGSFGSAS